MSFVLFILGFVLGGLLSAVLTCALTVYIARPDYRKYINQIVINIYHKYQAWQTKRQQDKRKIVLKLK